VITSNKRLQGSPLTCIYHPATAERYAPEVAVSEDVGGYYSGGGFSNLFPRPAYQFFAVQQYLAKSVDPALKKYANFQGRGYPDVAAQGSRYYVRYQGQDALIGGTSASSPTFASVLVMINDARLARGLPKLGFVNPIIYLKGGFNGLTDITSGSSKGCSEIPQSGPGGFPAAKGWGELIMALSRYHAAC
jgi:tripeptidyl-peptidase I